MVKSLSRSLASSLVARRHQLFKPLIIYTAIVAVVAVVTVIAVPSLRVGLQSVFAVGGYSASDGLGQIDGSNTVYYLSSGQDNSPNAQGFNTPYYSVIDDIGHRLFVSDPNNLRVLVFNLDASNNLIDHTADFVLGQPDFKTTNSGTTDATFNGTAGLALDTTGNRLFVADSGNNRVMVFDVTAITNGESAVNVLGQTDFVTGTSGTTQAKFNRLEGLALDATGNRLFVADTNNYRVMVFDVAAITDGENAVNVLGQTDFVTGTSGTTQAKILGSFGLAFDATGSRLFVADGPNARVMVFDVAAITDGENAVNVLGQTDFVTGTSDTTQAKLFNPWGLAFDPTGSRLFVADSDNNRVMVFDVAAITDGENAVNVLGQTGFVTGTSDTTQAKLFIPYGLSFDITGNQLFVADGSNNRVMVFDVAAITDGENAVEVLGQIDETDSPVYTTGGANNAPNAQGFNAPEGIAIDEANHRIFVADTSNNRVLIFNLDTNDHIVDHTADFVLGQPDIKTVISGTTQSGMNGPRGLTYDAVRNFLFVSDTGNNRVLVYDVSTPSNGMAATYVLGQADYVSATSGNAATALNTPKDVEYDAVHDWLYVADVFSNRVVIYNVAPGHIASGIAASWVLGAADFGVNGSEGLPPDPDTLGHPEGVTFDSNNNRLFVADMKRDRIAVYDLADLVASGSGLTPQTAILGQPDSVSYGPWNGGAGGISRLNLSMCYYCVSNLHMAYDTTGDRLIVPDRGSNRILIYDVATVTTGQDAVDVIGQTDFDSNSSGAGASGLNLPQGLTYDQTNDLIYATDTNNNRVMIFSTGAAPTPTPTPGGGSNRQPILPDIIGFFPDRIVVNSDASATDSRNVLVQIYAHYGATFAGTVDVLLSNTPDFKTVIPFRYLIPPPDANSSWPKTVAWDLCFGLPADQPCNPGRKIVYARFYVNLPNIWPALTPIIPQTPNP